VTWSFTAQEMGDAYRFRDFDRRFCYSWMLRLVCQQDIEKSKTLKGVVEVA
jgi:hypothetical protein